MKVVSIVPKKPLVNGKEWLMTVEHEGKAYRKQVRLSQYMTKADVPVQFVKAIREIDRDIAYELHGDMWREHCTLTSSYFGALTDEEQKRIYSEFVKEIE